MDSGSMTSEEVDQVANDFLDGEIVDLASDWLGNTVSFAHLFWLEPYANSRVAGRAEVVREVLPRAQAPDAGAYCPQLGYDWHPQEWNLGGSENYRLRSNSGRSRVDCPELEGIRTSPPA